ncbi:MAG: arylsulfatase [Tepidisphaeraceae bacterium]
MRHNPRLNPRLLGFVTFTAFLSAVVFPNLALPATELAPAGKPNIVVILTDDMGSSDLGCYGGEIDTPNIDKLASKGVRFTQFYNTARCCPTRASLLTGLYPHQAGMGWMTGHVSEFPGYSAELSRDAVTISEALKPAGYSSYMAGKWHITSQALPKAEQFNWPRQRGFDRFYGTIMGGGNYSDPAMLTRDDTPITPDNDPEYKPDNYYYTDAIADQAARFITEHRDRAGGEKPFFLYVAFTAPHWPLHAPPETIAKYKGKYDAGYEAIRAKRFERMKSLGVIDKTAELSPAPIKWEDVERKEWEARCMEVYAAQVDRMDQGVGRVVAALEKTGQLDNTLILYLHDNGGCAEKMGRTVHEDRAQAAATQPMKPDEIQTVVFPKFTRSGQPVRDGHIVMPGPETSFVAYGQGWANVSNTPLREYKHWVHEGGITTPLIAHWPAGIARHGAIERQPGHLIDVMATCIEVSGAPYPKEVSGRAITPMQGVSLAPAFRGESLDRARPIFFEHEANRAVRDGRWKLVAKGITGPWELYDIDADRSELHNLASQQPDRVKTMAGAWQRWAEASQVLPLNDRSKPASRPAR